STRRARPSPSARLSWLQASWAYSHLTLTGIDVKHSVRIDIRRWKEEGPHEHDHRGRGPATRDGGDVLPRPLAPGVDPDRDGCRAPAGTVHPRVEHGPGGGEDRVRLAAHRDRAAGDDVSGPGEGPLRRDPPHRRGQAPHDLLPGAQLADRPGPDVRAGVDLPRRSSRVP